jgi:hypothetical protein
VEQEASLWEWEIQSFGKQEVGTLQPVQDQQAQCSEAQGSNMVALGLPDLLEVEVADLSQMPPCQSLICAEMHQGKRTMQPRSPQVADCCSR